MRKLLTNLIFSAKQPPQKSKIESYLDGGRIPWSQGYLEYKYKSINDTLGSPESLIGFTKKSLPVGFGLGVDERVVEYPWIFSKLSKAKSFILDAGSTFNFDFVVNHPEIKNKQLTIYTFFPEKNCFFDQRINYVFGDLRDLLFKNELFDEIVSQSTIEHIDMDNSIYGYEGEKTTEKKSYEYLKAISEMLRVLKPGGKLLVTFPFGKYEYHGFFQQFDQEMLQKILDLLVGGTTSVEYFKYEKTGWRFAAKEELSEVVSYNPHTGKGKGDDGAAHCRSIACIEFIKKI